MFVNFQPLEIPIHLMLGGCFVNKEESPAAPI